MSVRHHSSGLEPEPRRQPRTDNNPAKTRRALIATVLIVTTGVLPIFLTGAAGVQIRRDLGLSESGLGLAFMCFYIVSSVFSAPFGRLAERIGPVESMRLSAIGSGVVMAMIAAFGRSATVMYACLVLGGVVNALTQPASNLYITQAIPDGRLGVAFAIKQSAIPGGTLLGGLAVPTIALTIGWPWAFAIAALLAGAGAVLVTHVDGTTTRRAKQSGPRDQPISTLVLLGVAIGLGGMAASGLGSFATSSFVEAKFSPALAGWFAAAGSALVIIHRLSLGFWADGRGADRRDHFGRVAVLLCIGTLGMALMSTMQRPLLLVGAALAYTAGWGWPGLFNLSIARANPTSPAAASGVTQTGTYIGAGLGPYIFGTLAQHLSYHAAWRFGAFCALASAIGMLTGRLRLMSTKQPVKALAL